MCLYVFKRSVTNYNDKLNLPPQHKTVYTNTQYTEKQNTDLHS